MPVRTIVRHFHASCSVSSHQKEFMTGTKCSLQTLVTDQTQPHILHSGSLGQKVSGVFIICIGISRQKIPGVSSSFIPGNAPTIPQDWWELLCCFFREKHSNHCTFNVFFPQITAVLDYNKVGFEGQNSRVLEFDREITIYFKKF